MENGNTSVSPNFFVNEAHSELVFDRRGRSLYRLRWEMNSKRERMMNLTLWKKKKEGKSPC